MISDKRTSEINYYKKYHYCYGIIGRRVQQRTTVDYSFRITSNIFAKYVSIFTVHSHCNT
jgi:hypothetical protein